MPQTGRTAARHDPALEAACGVGSYEWWPAEDRRVWSSGLIRMYGLSRAPAAEEGFSRLVHPDDRVRVEAETLADLGSGAESFSHSFRIVRPDGSVRLILDRGAIERDENGFVRVVRGLNIDVTGDSQPDRRAQADNEIEEKLRESTATLLHAQRCAQAGVWDVDLVNNRVTWSEPYYELYGLPRSVKPSHESWMASIHPDDRERVDAEFAEAVAGRGVQRIEFRILRDGQVRWLHSEGRAICDSANRPVRVTGITWDITARKDAEAALRESEERERLKRRELEAILEAIPAAVFISDDPVCARMSLNRAGYELLRLPTDANASKSAPEGEAPQHFEVQSKGRILMPSELPLQRAAATKSAIEGAEFELRFVDGDCKHFLGNALPLLDDRGEVRGAVGAFVDITERKRAEEALRERENQLAKDAAALARLDAASSRLWRTLSLREGLEEVLDASIELLGADKGYIRILEAGRDVMTIATHRGFEEPFLRCFREIATISDSACGRALRLSKRIVIEDVETDEGFAPYRRVAAAAGFRAVQSTPLIGRDGAPLGTLAAHFREPHRPSEQDLQRLDLYARKACDFIEWHRAKETLRESEERYRTLVKAASAITWRASSSGLCIESQPEWGAFTGQTAEEMLGDGWTKAVHPDDLAAVVSTRREAVARGGGFEIEHRLRRYDGQWRWVNVRVAPIRDASGEIVEWFGMDLDITERKEAEAALRESEERYRHLADAMPQLVWTASSEGVVEYYNARAAEFAVTITTQPITYEWTPAIHPDDLAPTWEAWREAVARGQTYQHEHRLLMADGSYRWHLSRGHPQRNEEGVIVKWFGSATDIDDLKQTDAQLAADLAALTRLHALSARTLQAEGLASLLQEVMDAAVAIVGAQHGTLQLLEGESLRIVAHHGHQPPFLEYFADAGNQASACGAALALGERVVVPDVETSDLFADTPSLPVLRAAGVRAVQSTPLVNREGKLVGVLTTQWDEPYCPDEHDLWRIDLLSRQAADLIENVRAREALRESERRERERRQELETTLAVIPVAVFIAEDKACARITANPAAHKLMRIPEGRNVSQSAPKDERPANFETYSATGEILAADHLSMQRAAATGKSIEGFEQELRFTDGDHKHLLGNALPLFDAAGEVRGAVGAFLDITERRHQEERIKLLLREVNHRAKNMLSLVLAVARQTAAASPKEFLERFSERIQALAASQDLLVKSDWKGAELSELVCGQLAHFQDLVGSRIELKGPSLLVSASAAQALGMAIHELSTNAGKYGALSVAEGRVAIGWGLERDGAGGETFTISWREQGGPPASPPSRSGFGSTVICALAESSLHAKVDLDFSKTGLSWRLRCPGAGVVGGTCSPPAAEPRSEPGTPGSSRPKVLVVEDEALIAMEIAHVLRKADFEVLGPVRAVAQALTLIEENGCDAAVLDINLSGETSEPVARKLRAEGTCFVTLSGYSRAQHPPIFAGVPALSKPLRAALLVAEIKRCIASKEDRQGQLPG